ncbi:MAG: hypothetical protein IJV25_04670 [Prevotella sp.]|nr:hypothetical protein [Prevotella sp.]
MKRLLGLTLLLTCLWAGAETSIPDMKFRRLDTPDGLSSSLINCIFKDSRGYVWIGTSYGLNRYDGYRIKTFYSNKRDSTTMRDNYTEQIFEAYDGKLWIKQGMNYCIYNPKTERFERNIQRELAKYGITGSVERLHIDSKKNFWIRIYDVGLVYYNPRTKKTNTFRFGYRSGQLKPDYGMSALAEDDNNMIIATNSGELVCLNGERGDIYWDTNYMRRNGGPENQDYRLIVDHQGNFWACAPGCSFVFIKKENRWYNSLAEYMHAKGVADFPENLQMWDIQIDENGWLWLACDHDALVIVDLKNGQWKQFKNNKYDETTLSDNTLRKVYLAKDGSAWIGTYKNGVCQYVPGLTSLRTVELGDITSTAEDRQGNYWLGTNDQGILVYNPKTEEIIGHFTASNSAMASNIVVGSWAASDGSLWFGSYNGGLTHCVPSASNPGQATVYNYQARPGELANNSVWALTEDKWNRIWFSTLGGGLQMLDPKTGKFTTWDTKNSKIPGDYLTSVGWNKKGWLMTGTSRFWSIVNPVSRQLLNQEIPEDPSITASVGSTNYIIEDSRGLYWHGSNVGIIVYDPKTKFQNLIDMTDGLYGSGINSIIEDKKHTIWAVTDHGISNIVPSRQEDGTWTFTVRSFNSRDGLQKATYNQRSAWLTRDGKILVGGQGGLDIIDPSLMQDKTNRERPVFSGLQIFDQDVVVGREVEGRVILDEALDVCRELSLRYDEQFTIQLSTNEVNVKNATRFAYRLEGFNDNWVKTSEQNPNITYNSLRAGSYLLCVRLLNDDGSLGKEESQLEITIRPPLWRTRWMILLYMIAIALIAWLWRLRFLKRHKERVELEDIRREVEKKQWMNEMLTKMKQESSDDEKRAFQTDRPWSMQPEDLNRTPGDLQLFMKEQCAEYKAPEGKKVKFSFFPLAHDLIIDFDHDMLGQAVQILLNNALMFSPKDCRIKVFVDKTSTVGTIRISDNGIGLPEGAKEHMFDPVVSDDDSGVCLSVVKDIVTAHGGTVTGDNNAGGGSVFTITLPLQYDEVEEAVVIQEE